MKSHISRKNLLKVKNRLPVNGMEIIAEKMNVSLSTVSRVLNGKTLKNREIMLELALEVIENSNEKSSLLSQKIKDL